MSLINDALKRAKQAQEAAATPPPTNDDLRPVEHRPYGRESVGMAVPTLLGIASLLLLFLLWQAARNSNSQDTSLEVKARTKAPAVLTAPTPEPAPAPNVPAVAQPSPAPAVTSVPSTSAPISQDATISSTVTASTDVAGLEPSTNPVPVAAVIPPKPALPRLQAVVFNPTRPSVMINSKTLFIGDKIGEFRVQRIDPDSVTLVSRTQTNVLVLPE